MRILFLLQSVLFFLIVKGQDYRWSSAHGGTEDDRAFAMATDNDGNVYTAGVFKGTADFDPGPGSFTLSSAGNFDIFVSKTSRDGKFAWAKRIGSATQDYTRAICIDKNNNILLAGGFSGTVDFDPGPGTRNMISQSGSADVFVCKLDSSGSLTWVKKIGDVFGDQAYAITTDMDGNVITAGYYEGVIDLDPGNGVQNATYDAGLDLFVQKLDPDGNLIWVKSISGPVWEIPASIQTDSKGNIVCSGNFQGITDFDPGNGVFKPSFRGSEDAFLFKLDSAGIFKWAGSIVGTATEIGYDIAIDKSDNIYFTGKFTNKCDLIFGGDSVNMQGSGGIDIFLIKYTTDGIICWAKNMGGAGTDECNSITISDDYKIYVTGYFTGTSDFDPGAGTKQLTAIDNSADAFVASYDSSGRIAWVIKVGGPGAEAAMNISCYKSNYLSISGYFSSPALDLDPGPDSTKHTCAGVFDVFIFNMSICKDPTAPTISAIATQTCIGSPITLSVISGDLNDAIAWKWYAQSCGGTFIAQGDSITVSPLQSETYFARAEGGCIFNPGICDDLFIKVNPLPSLTAILANDTGNKCIATITLTPSSGTPPYTYLWGANTGNKTTASLTGLCADTFCVVIRDNAGCTRDSCFTITNIQNGAISHNLPDVKHFPNPVTSAFHLQTAKTPVTIILTDINGRIILPSTLLPADIIHEIDMSAFPSGIYIVRISDAENAGQTIRIIKL